MTEFIDQDLSAARFEDVNLRGARFRDVSLAGAQFRNVDLSGVVIADAWLTDITMSGELENIRINGVDVVPLVEAELNRRYPDRVKMRPEDADGFREGWAAIERLWGQTVERARSFPAGELDVRVNEEWSFIETLRHLVFATDAWINRAILGQPLPFDPLGMPYDGMPANPAIALDRNARPSLDEVLVLRADRMATARRVFAELTDDQLAGSTTAVLEPGYPESVSFPVRRCLGAILNEEWEHRLYAERDLDELDRIRESAG